MKRLFLFTATFILVSISCEKEKDPIYEDFQSETLIRQIGTSEEDMQIFTYYNTGYIFEHLLRYSYNKFTYNSNNQLTKIEIALSLNPLSCAIVPGTSLEEGDDPRKAKIGQYVEYNYSNEGKLQSTHHYFINDNIPILMNYKKYEYSNNRVSKINVYNPQDRLNHYYIYSYDSNGNVGDEKYYFFEDSENAALQSTIVYEYDNMHNSFMVFAVEGTPGINTNKNNITSKTTTSYYDNEEYPYTEEYVYEYNELGYPVKVNGVEYKYGKEE